MREKPSRSRAGVPGCRGAGDGQGETHIRGTNRSRLRPPSAERSPTERVPPTVRKPLAQSPSCFRLISLSCFHIKCTLILKSGFPLLCLLCALHRAGRSALTQISA